jgi:cell division septation protein DedD
MNKEKYKENRSIRKEGLSMEIMVTTKIKTNTNKIYRVQVDAFTHKKNAEAIAKELKGKSYSLFVAE